jgi:hypothetical protein
VITIATLAVSPDRDGAVWITGPRGSGNLTHLTAILFDDVDEEYDRLQDTIAGRYLYAPTPDAASYARSLGEVPAAMRHLREPARELHAEVWRSHRRQVCNDPSVQHDEPRMRPVPGPAPQSHSRLALASAPVAANHLLAVWQSWLDAEREHALRHRPMSGHGERIIRLLPDEFVLAERPAGVSMFG